MTSSDPVVIVGSARTPMGGFQGDLKDAPAAMLGATAIKAALGRAVVAPDQIDEVVFGCVLPAGQGQAPARQAGLGAGLPYSTGATTITKCADRA
jgi:acetyl-CoA C-acetyltransferase